ncbi:MULTISPECIES: chemotaxis protein CheX [Rhizobium/Agrobacterium group]|uniref:chemotaxis protein CheX n=1 Tax=Rhizobium/Agrobacterium group TaxID=227290 RepID=UPI0008DC2B79|nr:MULTISPECIES: chemotaxis protein CheX [Rhizobium/Agrobacterium group]MCF1436988.1 chemotaxis protein CheX [Allorhizobium ampelinum]MCF1465084.1 chemotaxis protein CheX [Allorhizobium ampelinum]MCF1496215.1 chemotaxis protein CheX [Allorhizobium ampelinum]MUO92589.1 chemotaxis protein CheX [Agrobacterium vitis]MUZ55679.1 chemotaxis protein CheX [Agrobacterium vitis]
MSSGSLALDDLERDALTELVNIGVSRAAASLRKMVNRQVILSVPSVEVVTRKSAAALIGQRENEDLIAVHQQFEGPFSGRALLIFPESNGLSLVRAIIGEDMDDAGVAEIADEALAETGNVILNGCLGSMANMLQHTLKMSLPGVRRGNSAALFDVFDNTSDQSFVLFLYINFSVQDRKVRGYIAMLMDLPSLKKLKRLIADFIDRVIA